jgi:hypothetical protein
MKIQIAKVNNDVIQGYKHVLLAENYINFADISDNECEEILAYDTLNYFSINKLRDCLVSLVGKLRLGGKLVIGGVDIRLFSRFIINNTIKEEEGAAIIGQVSSMTTINQIIAMLESLGLELVIVDISGVHFKITVKRG